MKCEDLLKMLNDYVDEDIDPAVCETFEDHLLDCNPCQVVVDNIRQTIRLYKDDKPFPLPAEFQRNIDQILQEKWKAKFGSNT